jgi:hypothetical protein
MAITIRRIEDWRGQDVRDRDDESLGKLQEIWLDVGTGTPLLASIRSGRLLRHTKMIPIDGATVAPDHLRVAHDRATIDASPDAAGDQPPSAVELDEIGKAYGLRFSDQVRLESATEVDRRRAEAEAARRRAEELETEAREKAAALEEARARSQETSERAAQAQREAEQAREAARRARADADDSDV